MISFSGISIFLLGNKMEQGGVVLSNGMQDEYDISKMQGNFLIPIGRTGYMSRDLWRKLMEEIKDEPLYEHYYADLMAIGDNDKSLDEIIDLVVKLIKNIN